MSTTGNSRDLEAIPGKAVTFLKSVATDADVRHAMLQAGFTEAERQHGWKLVLDAAGYAGVIDPGVVAADDQARAAIAELDAWDGPGFQRIHAALSRLHPEADRFVFDGLVADVGGKSVVAVGKLIERLDALESSPDRAATRVADQAALATLAARGIDKAERDRLKALVAIVTSQADAAPPPPVVDADRQAKLETLAAWYDDWSTTARAIVTKRAKLVALGLKKRRRAAKVEAA